MLRLTAILLASAVLLTGCMQDFPVMRDEAARHTALPVFMIPRTVPADPFTLQAYERVRSKFTNAIIYIEGDNSPTNYPDLFSVSAPPVDSVGLRLAAQDGSPNVIYLARPCGSFRTSKYQGKDECPGIFRTDAKYSEAVIHGYMNALDNIKAYYNLTGFELVGYDGGAAIATILASQRPDVTSLRTVAGNLDTKTTAAVNKTLPPSKSYNPLDYASKLTMMPQRHFVGKLDHVTPPEVYSSYAQALGSTPCNSVSLIDNADHQRGWVEQWKTLRALPAACTQPVQAEPMPVTFDPKTLDDHSGPDHGQK